MTNEAREAALEAVVRASHEVFMRTTDRLTGPLDALGLTHATAQALWVIDPDEAPPSMKELATRMHCNAPNLNFVVNQLSARGLLERGTDPADRRVRVAVLTERGREVRERVVRLTLDRSPFADCDPTEIARLAETLRRVLGQAD